MNEASESSEEALVITLQDAEEANSLETRNQQETRLPESGSWPNKIFTRLLVNNVYVKFQLDCGASCNVLKERDMPVTLAKQMRFTQVLRMQDGSLMSPLATITTSLYNPRNGQEI